MTLLRTEMKDECGHTNEIEERRSHESASILSQAPARSVRSTRATAHRTLNTDRSPQIA
jgi:hypothetical protein